MRPLSKVETGLGMFDSPQENSSLILFFIFFLLVHSFIYSFFSLLNIHRKIIIWFVFSIFFCALLIFYPYLTSHVILYFFRDEPLTLVLFLHVKHIFYEGENIREMSHDDDILSLLFILSHYVCYSLSICNYVFHVKQKFE